MFFRPFLQILKVSFNSYPTLQSPCCPSIFLSENVIICTFSKYTLNSLTRSMDTRTGEDPHGYSHSMFYFDNEPLITGLSTMTVLSAKQWNWKWDQWCRNNYWLIFWKLLLQVSFLSSFTLFFFFFGLNERPNKRTKLLTLWEEAVFREESLLWFLTFLFKANCQLQVS